MSQKQNSGTPQKQQPPKNQPQAPQPDFSTFEKPKLSIEEPLAPEDPIENQIVGTSFKKGDLVSKKEAAEIIKKIDQGNNDMANAEELMSLCLPKANRKSINDLGVLSFLVSGLKTKPDDVREIFLKILTLYAQDGVEVCEQINSFNISSVLFDEIYTKSKNKFLKMGASILIFWLAQSPGFMTFFCVQIILKISKTSFFGNLSKKIKQL